MWSIVLLLVFGSAFARPASQPLYHSQYVSAQAIPTVQYRTQPDATQYLTQVNYGRGKGQGLQQYSTHQAADRQAQKAQFGGPHYLQQIQAAQQQAEPQENYPVQRKATLQSFGGQQQQVRYVPQKPAAQGYRQNEQQKIEQEEEEEYDPNPSYQFGFDVKDDLYTNYQNRKEQKEGNKITGSYSVVDSDGFLRTVTYTADPKEGFKAEVHRQPTDIVVKIPKREPPNFERHRPDQQYLQAIPLRKGPTRPAEKDNASYQYQ
ncbi:calcium-responsive transactivator-like [Coccinella septempunctata]|uniref:calcium-responsive transactivator-like n=1 Tax=Coccinella septempunctata TaxID=41139 RepID=UPI001D06D946|nr:calcium-responsive transactivator-like [Coccinella septempunctata]